MAWRGSQFSRDDYVKLNMSPASVYVIKRVRVLTYAGQSIDHDWVVDKLNNSCLIKSTTSSTLS